MNAFVLFSFSNFIYANSYEEKFPTGPFIDKQVRFWELVFDKYDSNTAIIHDKKYPEVILDIIDFKKYGKEYRAYKARRNLAELYQQRYRIGLRRFAEQNIGAANHGKIEQRIYNSYQRNEEALDLLLRGNAQIRIQFGMANEFRTALFRALQYLPHIEKVFQEYDLPIELTRLPFVESMFQVTAQSKVGAQGIWQFMPETARSYLKVNHLIDERFSPYKATRAAAKFLNDNYKMLKSWPLAITAYNHGPSSIRNAVNKHNTTDLEFIIKNYKAPSFGFASSNFYAEFLAVNNIFNKYRNYIDEHAHSIAHQIKSVKLDGYYSLSQLTKSTPLTAELIRKHNPEIRQNGYLFYMDNPLPKNFEIFFPANLSHDVNVAMNNIRAASL